MNTAATVLPDTRKGRLLVALSSVERSQFFPTGFDGWAETDKTCVDGRDLWGGREPTELNEEEWRAALRDNDVSAILGGWRMPPLSPAILAECPNLAYVCYLTGTVRNKIPRAFLERGGIVSNWGDEAAPTVAECALMLSLMCLRQATRYALEMHVDRVWKAPIRHPELPRPLSLMNRRVGLHGFGAVARALVRLLAPFNVTIEAYSAPVPAAIYAEHGVRKARDLQSLYRDNDVVFVLEGLTPQTAGSVDAALLAELRPGSVLVNVARGGLVDEAALAQRAARGDVQIGLDVYAAEPLAADSPLRGLRNVTLLPHTAGPTIDWYPHCGRRALRNLAAWRAGLRPPDALSLERYDCST